jgi:hypothetical protein
LRAWLAIVAQHSIDLIAINGVERMRLLGFVGHTTIMPEQSVQSSTSDRSPDGG